ncbi:MAG: M48 family metallopeptidase [Thiotrichaceae bacterium]
MKSYHNPQPEEGINVTKVHPLRTFVKLFSAISVVLVVSAWLFGQSGSWLASLIPYQHEVSISKLYTEPEELDKKHQQIQEYLETLVSRLEKGMALPEGMHIHVHYEPENVENAFATLGGHLFIYRGLLDMLPNENSLAMLLAHEMAHVKLRHPIRAAGQNIAIKTGIKYLLGYSNSDLLGSAGLYTQLHFSRSMESAADEEGLQAVYRSYGTVAGASDLFETLHEISVQNGMDGESPFFSTHPLDKKRINDLNQLAMDKDWENGQEAQPFPEKFTDWL